MQVEPLRNCLELYFVDCKEISRQVIILLRCTLKTILLFARFENFA